MWWVWRGIFLLQLMGPSVDGLLLEATLCWAGLASAAAAAGQVESVRPAGGAAHDFRLATAPSCSTPLRPPRPPPLLPCCSKPVLKEQLRVAIREATQGRRASHNA